MNVKLSFSTFAITMSLFFMVDQALLPMFHPLEIPIKPSYIVLFLVPFVARFSRCNVYAIAEKRQRLWTMTSPIVGIALVGFVGQLYLMTLGNVLDPFVAIKQLTQYILMVFAFSMGQRVPQFPLRAILWIFYGAIATLLVLSLASEHFPWFADLWWKTEEIKEERLIQNQLRPTPFGDGSMVAAVLLYLFIVVSVRLRYLSIEKYHVIISTLLLLITAFILSSRNQGVAAIILGAFLFIQGRLNIIRKLLFLFIILIFTAILFNHYEKTMRQNHGFMDYAYSRIEISNILEAKERSDENSILRPLVRFDRFFNRFIESPIFGTGFSTLSYHPFLRLNFHNDLFYIWATSGAIGGILYFLWMFRIYKALGLIILLPFFLPGLTNSFITHVSGVLIYCFMLGVLIERRSLQKYIAKEKIENLSSALSPHVKGYSF